MVAKRVITDDEFFEYIIEGKRYKEIGRALGIHHDSVKRIGAEAVDRMGARTLPQAVGLWVRQREVLARVEVVINGEKYKLK